MNVILKVPNQAAEFGTECEVILPKGWNHQKLQVLSTQVIPFWLSLCKEFKTVVDERLHFTVFQLTSCLS